MAIAFIQNRNFIKIKGFHKSDREGELLYDIPHMWNLKRNDTKQIYLQKRKRLRLENELMVAGGEGEGLAEGIAREFGVNMGTLLYLKWTANKDGITRALDVTWQPGWKVSLGENATFTCVAESLRYSPETITTLLTGYTPIQNKNFLK